MARLKEENERRMIEFEKKQQELLDGMVDKEKQINLIKSSVRSDRLKRFVPFDENTPKGGQSALKGRKATQAAGGMDKIELGANIVSTFAPVVGTIAETVFKLIDDKTKEKHYQEMGRLEEEHERRMIEFEKKQ